MKVLLVAVILALAGPASAKRIDLQRLSRTPKATEGDHAVLAHVQTLRLSSAGGKLAGAALAAVGVGWGIANALGLAPASHGEAVTFLLGGGASGGAGFLLSKWAGLLERTPIYRSASRRVELDRIVDTLARYDGDVALAAKDLDRDPSALHRLIERRLLLSDALSP